MLFPSSIVTHFQVDCQTPRSLLLISIRIYPMIWQENWHTSKGTINTYSGVSLKSLRLIIADSLTSRIEAALNTFLVIPNMAFSYCILRAPTSSKTQRTTVPAGIRQHIASNPPGDPIVVIAPPVDTNHNATSLSKHKHSQASYGQVC